MVCTLFFLEILQLAHDSTPYPAHQEMSKVEQWSMGFFYLFINTIYFVSTISEYVLWLKDREWRLI